MRSITSSKINLQAAGAIALAGAFATQLAAAGPAVGTVLGAPSSTTTTVQARVVSSTPVVAQVATPREVCYDELRTQDARPSGAGALLGAVAGAAVGNAVGKGSGRAVATGVGLIGGAILGNHIENRGRPQETQTVRRCEQQSAYENQVVAYNVVYEINGQQYSTQLPHEPGRTLPVQISVSPVSPAPVAGSAWHSSYTPVTYTRPVVVVAPAHPVRVVRDVYPSRVVVLRDADRHRGHPQGRRHGHHHDDDRVAYAGGGRRWD